MRKKETVSEIDHQLPVMKDDHLPPKTSRTPLIIAVAVVLIVGCVLGLIFGSCAHKRKIGGGGTTATTAEPFDPKEWGAMPDDSWKSITVTLNKADYLVTDADVEEQIHTLQEYYLEDCPTLNKIVDVAARDGDEAFIYYVGYMDGKPFAGGSNLTLKKSADSSGEVTYELADPYGLKLGSGSFIPGFEEGLIGVRPDSTSLSVSTTGTVEAGNVIYFRFTSTQNGDTDNPNTDFSSTPARIPLTDEATVDAIWGAGFYQSVLGATVSPDGSSKLNFSATADFDGDGAEDTRAYSGEVIMRSESETPRSISLRFPDVYPQNPAFGGKDAVFEVFFMYLPDYQYPPLTAEFVTDTLKFTAEESSGDPVEDLKNDIRAYLQENADLNRESDAAAKIFDALTEKFVMNAWPDDRVQKTVDSYRESLHSDYEYNASMYEQTYGIPYGLTYEQYARYACGLEAEADVDAYILERARAAVKEDVLVMYMGEELSLSVSDEEILDYAGVIAQQDNNYYYGGMSIYTAEDEIEARGKDYFRLSLLYYKIVKEMMNRYVTIVDA